MKRLIKCIIVSGPDNCGKDTACEGVKAALQNQFGVYPVYISSKFSKAVNDWPGEMKMLKKFVDDFKSDNAVLLLNRSWFDECVYGPMYRGYADEDLDWIWRNVDYSEILYVALTAPVGTLVAREDGKSFSHGKAGTIAKEKEIFDSIAKRLALETSANVIIFDTSKNGPEDIVEEVCHKFNNILCGE